MTLLEQLHQLAPLAAAVTPAPWLVNPATGGDLAGLIETTDSEPICQVYGNTWNEVTEEEHGEFDAAFIAATRNLLTPANLQRLIALEAAALAAPVAAAPSEHEDFRHLLASFPEINVGNYADEDACALNNWGIEVCNTYDKLAARGPAAPPAGDAITILNELRQGLGAGGRGAGMFHEVELGGIIIDACIDRLQAMEGGQPNA
jgi:hypothetical protein